MAWSVPSTLASASAQQLPALRKFSDFQDVMVWQVWQTIYERVIENAVKAGTLSEMVEEQDEDGDPVLDDLGQTEQIKSVEAFALAGPELETDDPKTLAEALQIAVNMEWVSNETASSRMGYDPRIERKKRKRERQEQAADAAQGAGLPPEQPGGSTLADFAGVAPGGNGREPQTQTATEAANDMPMEGDGMLHVRLPQTVVNIPEQPAPVINITLPEILPAQVTVNVPRQSAPVVHVAAPIAVPAPAVYVPPPDTRPETLTVERDADGRIVTIRKERS